MTLDAMHWVWKHARSTGNARIVLLAVADATTGPEATTRMGNAELRARLGGVSKSTVTAALERALVSGELEIAEPGRGSRPALYRLPAAVGYARNSAPESGAQNDRPETRGTTGLHPDSQGTTGAATAPDSGAQRDHGEKGLRPGNQGACAPESGPHHSPRERVIEGMGERPSPAVIEGGIPEFARPLVDTLTASGVIVRWDLGTGEWFTLDAMLQRSGADLLAAAAVKAAAKADIGHARYLLRAWRSLPPRPAAGTAAVTPQQHTGPNVLPFDAAAPRRTRAQRTADELALILAREAAQQ